MHCDMTWQQIIHDNQANIFPSKLVAIKPEELRKQGAGILVEIHVIAGQEFLEEFALLVLHRFNDKLVVVCEIEDGAAGPGVRQFPQRRRTHRHQEVVRLDSEQFTEVSESLIQMLYMKTLTHMLINLHQLGPVVLSSSPGI